MTMTQILTDSLASFARVVTVAFDFCPVSFAEVCAQYFEVCWDISDAWGTTAGH